MKRIVLVVLGPLAALSAFIGAAVATAAAQPDPLATHWGLSGAPDGAASLLGFVVAVTGAASAAWLVLIAQCRRHGSRELTVAPPAWGVMWLVLALGAVVLAANAGAVDWRQARAVTLTVALVPMLAGAAGAATAWLLERGRAMPRAVARISAAQLGAASIGLADDERAVWSAHAQSRSIRRAAVAAVVALGSGALLVGGPQGAFLGLLGIVVVCSALVVSEVEVTIDERGLSVGLGPFGRPRVNVPLSAIAGAERIDVDPWEWGGWGYRKVPRRRGATAIVMHRGEALRVITHEGRELVVTVADAGTAAALLSDLVGRHGGMVPA